MIAINRPNSAVLHSWAIVDDDINKFRCRFRRYLCDWTIERRATPIKIITHAHGAETIQGWGLFIQLESDDQCRNNSKEERIQGNMIYLTSTHMHWTLLKGYYSHVYVCMRTIVCVHAHECFQLLSWNLPHASFVHRRKQVSSDSLWYFQCFCHVAFTENALFWSSGIIC